MINAIKKIFVNYVETEKLLTQLRCLIVDNGQKIRKVIKTFPKKSRNQAMVFAYYSAYWGFSLDKIINKLKELRATS